MMPRLLLLGEILSELACRFDRLGEAELSGAHDAQGQSLPPLQGCYVDIWRKRAGNWHIVADRPIVPAPAAK